MTSSLFRSSLVALLVGGAALPSAEADVIDFSVVDETTPTGLVQRIGPATFSWDLYNWDDGFWLHDGGVYNYFGENHEYIEFDQPVEFQSIDLRQFDEPSLLLPDSMIVHLFDEQLTLISSREIFATPQLTTYFLGQQGVKRIEFEFTGGGPFYSDSRDHAWYYLDNLVFDEGPLTLDSIPPMPAANDFLVFTTTNGRPGLPYMLLATSVNGTPIFTRVLVSSFGGDGSHAFGATVPAGLAGVQVTFRSLGYALTSKLQLSNGEEVTFQ
jgi:hypothetical protein